MPPFFGEAHFYSALQNEALPALERVAADDTARARSLKRFERDDPPPYTSSTESEELDDDPLLIPHSDGRVPQELIALTEPPLTDEEISLPAYAMRFALNPSAVYGREARYLVKRLRGHAPYRINPLFRDKYGHRRAGVLIRHYIRRRWEKLGIWNPEWGVPTRNKQPNDDVHKWRWKWEPNNPDDSGFRSSKAVNPPYKGELLVAHAMGLRRNLRRSESSPVVPRSHLPPDASASEAESFLMSRPWFIFSIEVIEESERFGRLDAKYRRFYHPNYTQHVVQWWKERGDWREKFEMPDGSRLVHSWKWRHESPSPEPDDLTSIDNIKEGLSDAIDMDFTPSELDAFDAIPPLGYESPMAPKSPAEDDSHLPRPLFNLFSPGKISYNRQLDAPQEPELQPSESQQNASATPQDSQY